MSRGFALTVTMLLSVAVATVGCSDQRQVERVILVTLDTTRADRIGCYGYEQASTPSFDRLASESTLFEEAVSVVPTTLPAHSTIFTGQYPQDHGVRYNLYRPLAPDAVTLAETLSEAGFATAAFPASQIVHSRFGLAQGFQTWIEPPEAIDRDEDNPVRRAERNAEEGVDLALDWLRENPDGRQFVWLHFYDPHFNYKPPFPYSSSFRDRPYDGEIAYMDAQFGRLLDALRDDGRWDETAVIVVGDHGEGLYDHDERWHQFLLYEATQHVPLIVRAPGRAPHRVAEPVSQVDLAPTVLELVGLAPGAEMRGESLVPALDGDRLPKRDLYFETLAGSITYGWQELHGLRAGNWKLIDAVSSPELFDLVSDPAEETNLASVDAVRLGELRDALARVTPPLGGEDAPSDPSEAPALDPETEALLISLGYASGDVGGAAEGAAHPRTMVDLEAELLAAQSGIARGQWKRVEELCRYTLGRDPTNRWAIGAMVDALIGQQDLDGARDHAELFIRLFPDLPRGPTLMATVSMAENDPAEAYRIVNAALDDHPTDEDLNYRTLVAGFEAGVDGICPERVLGAIARFPTSGRMVVLRARCEAADGLTDAALDSLRAAGELGFTTIDFLEQQPEFADVVAHPDFAALRDGDSDSADGGGDADGS